MKQYDPLNVCHFTEKMAESVFTGDNTPHLVYITEVKPETSVYPRILHAHDDMLELFLISEGENDFMIGHGRYHVKKGDLLIHNAGVVHDHLSGPEQKLGYYCIAISGLHMPGLPADSLVPDGARFIYETGEWFEEICGLFRGIFRKLTSGSCYCEEVCQGLLCALLYEILEVIRDREERDNAKQHQNGEDGQIKSGVKQADSKEEQRDNCQRQDNESAEGKETERFLPRQASSLGRQVQEYMDRHYTEPISLDDISNALHISRFHLSHVFKDMCGYSPIQYLLRRRIGEAQSLLIETDLSVAEVAEKVGFEDQSYFNHQFTKLVGMPPQKYRQNYLV